LVFVPSGHHHRAGERVSCSQPLYSHPQSPAVLVLLRPATSHGRAATTPRMSQEFRFQPHLERFVPVSARSRGSALRARVDAVHRDSILARCSASRAGQNLSARTSLVVAYSLGLRRVIPRVAWRFAISPPAPSLGSTALARDHARLRSASARCSAASSLTDSLPDPHPRACPRAARQRLRLARRRRGRAGPRVSGDGTRRSSTSTPPTSGSVDHRSGARVLPGSWRCPLNVFVPHATAGVGRLSRRVPVRRRPGRLARTAPAARRPATATPHFSPCHGPINVLPALVARHRCSRCSPVGRLLVSGRAVVLGRPQPATTRVVRCGSLSWPVDWPDDPFLVSLCRGSAHHLRRDVALAVATGRATSAMRLSPTPTGRPGHAPRLGHPLAGLNQYPPGNGAPKLRHAIAAHHVKCVLLLLRRRHEVR